MTAENVQKKLMTAAEVAAEYGWPLATLRYWVQQGSAPRSARIGRRRMFRRDDVEQWIADQFDGAAR